MDVQTQEVYSEVYGILNMLGDSYIKKLPSSLIAMIEKEKKQDYSPKYISIESLNQQNIKRDSLSMIALLHLNYWCDSNEEKKQLREIFQKNEEKHQALIREKYNPENLFKEKEEVKETLKIEESTSIIEYKEQNFFRKILNKIIRFLKFG